MDGECYLDILGVDVVNGYARKWPQYGQNSPRYTASALHAAR